MLEKLAHNRIYLSVTIAVVVLTFTQWTLRIIHSDSTTESTYNVERYNLDLNTLNSMDKLSAYIDSLSKEQQVSIENPEAYVRLIDGIIRERFYHGTSEIHFRENYIAWIAGKLFWSHFSVGVTPDEILSHPKALCSQSAIVFQEIVKEKGFKVRAVGLKRHFCSEVYYEGSWHFIDSDKEPIFDDEEPLPSVDELSKDEQLIARAYLKDTDNVTMDQLKDIFNSNEILFFHENEFPAKNMRIFQRITRNLSDFLWILLLIPILYSYFRSWGVTNS